MLLKNIISNFNRDEVLTIEKTRLVDKAVVKAKIDLIHFENVCSIKVSTNLDKDYLKTAKTIINHLNSHPTIGLYQLEDGFLNLLVSIWLKDELVNEELEDIIDVLASKIATTLSMIKWRKEEDDGRK